MRARAAKSPHKGRLILWPILALLGAAASPACAQEYPVRDNFGGVGMIDMPSAHMAPDGELSVGASYSQNTQHYNAAFQILPWLEASFRYSGLTQYHPDYPVYWDRSFAVKARLWNETEILPAFAVGINDLIGTGVYSGEYLVASKRLGAFDVSLGMGWGRLGSTALFKNPLASLFPSFESRSTLTSGAGAANFNLLFHGHDAGLFGGVIWHTPIKKLSLIAEYSSDRYSLEAERGGFKPRNQLNFGASYRVSDGMTIGIDWLYGRSLGGNVSFQINPKESQYTAKLQPAPIQVAVRAPEEQQQALQIFLRRNQGREAPQKRANATRAAFVDALWQPEIKNAELQGQSLVLTAGGDAGRNCIFAAKLSQSFEGNIRNIIVRGTNGEKPVQCTTVSATDPVYQITYPLNYEPRTAAASSSSPRLQTINAAGSDINAANRAIRTDAAKQNIVIEAVSISDAIATVYYTNTHYFAEADALDRLTRIMMKDTPAEIEKFRFIAVINGVPQQGFDILRGPEERKYVQTDSLDLFAGASNTSIVPPPMQNPALAESSRRGYPRFSWNIFPQLRQELFDPDNPLAINLTAAATGSVELRPGLSFNGEAETSLYNNFVTSRRSESVLPHVRSDFLEYFAQGRTGIGQLDAQYRFRLAPTVFAIAKAGYLESMFAGGGGEVLWRPEGQRWALGVDGYEVWQRGFDRLFDLRNYHVFTGHVSLYYASPWHDLNFMVSAGQYLAGDRGLTFQMTRRFSTGVEIGAFFTKTNVSSAQFGEGSFDKGIIIRIPLGWALPVDTQGEWRLDLRPVQRDGGQRLAADAPLYDETRRSSYAEIQNTALAGH